MGDGRAIIVIFSNGMGMGVCVKVLDSIKTISFGWFLWKCNSYSSLLFINWYNNPLVCLQNDLL